MNCSLQNGGKKPENMSEVIVKAAHISDRHTVKFTQEYYSLDLLFFILTVTKKYGKAIQLLTISLVTDVGFTGLDISLLLVWIADDP